MQAPEQPKPNQPNKSTESVFDKMDKIKNEFFDSIKVITDDYEQKRMFNSLTMGSYIANRGYGMTPESYAKLFNWSAETMNQYEAAYQAQLQHERREAGYNKLLKDLQIEHEEGKEFDDYLNNLNK